MTFPTPLTIEEAICIEWIPEISHVGFSLSSPRRKVYIGTLLKKEEYVGLRQFVIEELKDTLTKIAQQEREAGRIDALQSLRDMMENKKTRAEYYNGKTMCEYWIIVIDEEIKRLKA